MIELGDEIWHRCAEEDLTPIQSEKALIDGVVKVLQEEYNYEEEDLEEFVGSQRYYDEDTIDEYQQEELVWQEEIETLDAKYNKKRVTTPVADVEKSTVGSNLSDKNTKPAAKPTAVKRPPLWEESTASDLSDMNKKSAAKPHAERASPDCEASNASDLSESTVALKRDEIAPGKPTEIEQEGVQGAVTSLEKNNQFGTVDGKCYHVIMVMS